MTVAQESSLPPRPVRRAEPFALTELRGTSPKDLHVSQEEVAEWPVHKILVRVEAITKHCKSPRGP